MLGLRTVIYPVADLAAATDWYQEVFQTTAYFNEPFYVGFALDLNVSISKLRKCSSIRRFI